MVKTKAGAEEVAARLAGGLRPIDLGGMEMVLGSERVGQVARSLGGWVLAS